MKENFIYKFVKKNNISKSIFVSYIVAFVVICYFLSFAIFGDKGLLKLHALQEKIENKKIIQRDFSEQVKTKQKMVDSMDPKSLDLDLLDEQARKVLGYAGKNEIIIYKKEEEKSD